MTTKRKLDTWLTPKRMMDALVKHKGKTASAAKELDVSISAFRSHMTDEMREYCLQVRESLVDLAEVKLEKALATDQWWAIQMVLRTHGKDRGWTQKDEVQVSGTLDTRAQEAKNEGMTKLLKLYEEAQQATGTDDKRGHRTSPVP